MKKYPESRLGKLAVGLTTIYIITLLIFFLFMALGIVDFDTGHCWDITLGIVIPIELVAFVLSIIAIGKEKTTLVKFSLIVGIISILFLLTHSLYIKD